MNAPLNAPVKSPLRYSRDDLMASHPYARPHEEAGYRLHGGFLADGTYVSPRTLVRTPAVAAWAQALEARGWPVIDASVELMKRPGFPNFEQQRLLIGEGLGQTFWDSLTVTGIIEARGRGLCDLPAPDFSQRIVDDLSDTATGHLGKGLLYAHGADEGGDPARPGEGAHDAMWFAARDLAFGKDAWPLAGAPDSIARETPGREMPDLTEGMEQFVKFLMNVLMIEIRAESFFDLCQRLFRDPALWGERRAGADKAAELVERIRTDEAIHVSYLRVVLSEMRSFTWRTVSGAEKRGAEILDPMWETMVVWHGRTQRDLAAERSRDQLHSRLVAERGAAGARALLARLDALAEESVAA
ncbi:MAG TPA: hypothetical protein VGF71_13605 [Caulobacteraceae bacterium]|jgi:hypothetical protein